MEKPEETAMPKKRIRFSEQHRGTEDRNEERGQYKPAAVSRTKTKNKVQYERVPWTGEEKLSVRMHFASYIMRGALPEKEVIEEFFGETSMA